MRILFHGLLVLAIILGFFAFSYDPGVLAIAGCIAVVVALGWLARKVPNISPTQRNLKVSWKILVLLGFSVPTIFFFLFTSELISLAVGTVIVGAILVLGLREIIDQMGKERSQRPPETRPDDRCLRLLRSLLRLHPRVLRATWDERLRGRLHRLPPLDKEEDHTATLAKQVLFSTWVQNARTNRPWLKIAGLRKTSEQFRVLFQ